MRSISTLATLLLGLAVILSGCGLKEQRAERDHDECLSMGASFGTPEYVNCRVVLKQVREQRKANAAAAYANTTQ